LLYCAFKYAGDMRGVFMVMGMAGGLDGCVG
jgi:hypothetical protein